MQNFLPRPWRCGLAVAVAAFAAGPARALTPNDTYFMQSWHLPVIDAPAAWDISTGSPNVRVAVLDAGLDSNHPDLAGRVLTGFNVLNNSTDTSQGLIGGVLPVYHGTAVAGIIAGGVNNAEGGDGIGNFSIVPVKITDGNGAFSSDVLKALNWVADNAQAMNIRVLNLSYYFAPFPGYEDAIQRVRDAGVLPVGAIPNNDPFFFPAGYVAPPVKGLVLVGGTDHTNTLRPNIPSANAPSPNGSSYGATDLVAPSQDIVIPYFDQTGADPALYKIGLFGNSWAAPQVAGAAALAFSINPNLSPDQVEQMLKDTAKDLGAPGRDDFYGYGLLDVGAVAQAAVESAIPEPASMSMLLLGAVGLLKRRRR